MIGWFNWPIKLSDNKLSDNELSDYNLARKLKENGSFKPITIEEIVIFMIKLNTHSSPL